MNGSEFKAQCRARLEGVMQKREITEVSRMLLEAFAEVDRKDILLHPDRPLQSEQEKKLLSALELIASGTPVQYVLGKVSFFGMDIHVGPEVLIPRPETEELLQLALERIGRAQNVLDVGTGSGILALGWKKKRPDSEVTAVDLSEKALGYARRNAEANGCNVEFFSMDFLDASNWSRLPVCDLILSNPPYVPQRESEEMAPHVLQHEPHLALFVPDDDPLLFYRSLLGFARSGVQKGGNIALEMHPPCAEDVCKMFSDEGFSSDIVLDLSGKERFLFAEKNK
ncbi:MAG: peptide chain release factor N(5)-glutamine methyltransferase [Flavobacteriia bacterium]|nr:peptide chain release factor N(5)-glutamine methyltransferase [Flavobacteriia bacterium]